MRIPRSSNFVDRDEIGGVFVKPYGPSTWRAGACRPKAPSGFPEASSFWTGGPVDRNNTALISWYGLTVYQHGGTRRLGGLRYSM